MIESVAGEGLAVVASLHDGEDVLVVVLIDRLDQCSKTQEEVVDAESVVMDLHDGEDVEVVEPIDRLNRCSRNQEEVVDAESVVMAMAMAMERMEGGCYGVDER